MAEPKPDAGVLEVLRALGLRDPALLGFGGEAWVFALDAGRIVRIHHTGTSATSVRARVDLLGELGASSERVPFEIPTVEEVREMCGRQVTIERRLPGRAVSQLLTEVSGSARTALIRSYLEAADALGDLDIDRPWFGELCAETPLRFADYREYLRRRAAWNLGHAGPAFADVDAHALADALPEPAAPAFVHLDAFAGNMLGEGERVSAVIDFGVVALVGDRRLDALGAVAYLSPDITPAATPRDREESADWLRERGLIELLEPARRWLAAFWSPAVGDVKLHRWCRSVLTGAPDAKG